jgi:hypothetical protein
MVDEILEPSGIQGLMEDGVSAQDFRHGIRLFIVKRREQDEGNLLSPRAKLAQHLEA